MAKRFSSREKNILIVFIVVVLLGVVQFLVLKPARETFDTIDDKITAAEARYNKNLRAVEKAKALNKKYENLLKKFHQTGTNEQVMSSILSQIEEAANSLGIRIQDLKPQAVQRNDGYNQFLVSLTIDSEFADIIHFISVLQDPEYLFDMEEVRFDKNLSQSGTSIKTNLVLSKTLLP